MADLIHPVEIYGNNWKKGDAYALDFHTDPTNEVIGHNPVLDCPIYKKTYIGELMSNLKYNDKLKAAGKNELADKIVELALPWLDKWLVGKKVSMIVPAPFSEKRVIQPVQLIAQKIAAIRDKEYRDDLLINKSEKPSKQQGKDKIIDIRAAKNETINATVLLIDDIFESGATFDACINVLKNSYHINGIYLLSITKKKGTVMKI